MAGTPLKTENKEERCAELFDRILEAVTDMLGVSGSDRRHGRRADPRESSEEDSTGMAHDDEDALAEDIKAAFSGYATKDLTNMKKIVEELRLLSAGLVVKTKGNISEYLGFLREYCDVLGGSDAVLRGFTTLLGYSTDPEMLSQAAVRLFQVVFLRQCLPRVHFYDLSLLATLQRSSFKANEYMRKVVSWLTYMFVAEISRTYVSKRRYTITGQYLNEFSLKVEPLINAFNGIVNELGVDQAVISKIVFVMLIFELEKRSVLLKVCDSAELFYCAVRTFYSGIVFAKHLENILKTQLLWTFRSDTKKYTLDSIFQTFYKYEFKKYIGCITHAKVVSSRYSRATVAIPGCTINQRCRTSQDPHVANSVTGTKRRVCAFSPLSRRIAEIAGLRDNYDSKRKLSFD